MLPRRHILDVWEGAVGDQDRLLMSTGTLVVDAVKYVNNDPGRDHLVEALEFNEFLCFMEPSIRPNNLALLFHVMSDLLGLLLYGVPKKRQNTIEALQVVDYSSKNISYPIADVWRFLKNRIGPRRGKQDIIDGFIRKIRIEVDIFDRFPFVDDVFASSKRGLETWLGPLCRFYEKRGQDIEELYEEWSSLWLKAGARDALIESMVRRLVVQVEQDYGVKLDFGALVSVIKEDPAGNREENEKFSRLYKEGLDLLFSI